MNTATVLPPPAPPLAQVLLDCFADSHALPFVRYSCETDIRGEMTYGEAISRAARFAMALDDAGLKHGDRVLLALDNGPAFIDAWFGCALGGYVMVPLNTLLTGRLLEDVVRRSSPRAVVAAQPYVQALDALTGGCALRLIVDGEQPGWRAHAGAVSGSSGESGAGAGLAGGQLDNALPERLVSRAVSVKAGDALSIMFTSGTTGPAKGAVLSQAHCVARSISYREGLRIAPSDVMYTCLPLFHNNAQMASVLVAVVSRARTAIHDKFSVSRFWASIHESGATRFTLIGRMANLLLAAPASADERDHRVRSACIVPHPQGEEAFERRFGIRVVSQYYGCTEMIPLAPDIEQPRRVGSCGKPTPGFECAVVDEAGQLVPDGELGELVARPVRPEGVMSGYLDMPAETLRAFRGLWYHTGDIVRRDAEGFYYLVGRMKDFIRKKGENISAAEVEAALAGHQGVADCAAVGEPDAWGEEDVVLYVEPAPGATPEPSALLRRCAESLPTFMVPARIHLVEALPRNALGRIEKFKLRGGKIGQ